MCVAPQELFKKLVPHQCLGAVWSRRDKNRSQEAATVLATVNQFNAVSFRVISTILTEPDLKYSERGKIIAAWIDVAQVSTARGVPGIAAWRGPSSYSARFKAANLFRRNCGS